MQEDSINLDSGVLRTTRAFKKQIEAKGNQDDGSTPIIFGWTVLGALCMLRKSLREVCEELGPDSVSLHLVEDDEYGWPRLTLKSSHGEDALVSLVVGAQDRRTGTILAFKLCPTDLQLEMQETEYLDRENIQRTLRLFLRRFFDQVSKMLEEQHSLEKQFSNIFNSLDVPNVLEKVGQIGEIDSDNLFPGSLPDPGPLEEEEEGLLLGDDDFFE